MPSRGRLGYTARPLKDNFSRRRRKKSPAGGGWATRGVCKYVTITRFTTPFKRGCEALSQEGCGNPSWLRDVPYPSGRQGRGLVSVQYRFTGRFPGAILLDGVGPRTLRYGFGGPALEQPSPASLKKSNFVRGVSIYLGVIDPIVRKASRNNYLRRPTGVRLVTGARCGVEEPGVSV
jgi:hypothetical protein